MKCIYCNEEMEFDCTEGIGIDETHYYTCICGANVSIHENGCEDEWEVE